jgi:hypothetical protein
MTNLYKNGDPIDIDALIKAVRELAAENPDFIYSTHIDSAGATCLYTLADGTPDCIIGQAMARIGQPLPPQTTNVRNGCAIMDNGVGSAYWALAFGVEYFDYQTQDIRHSWLQEVQYEQDARATWAAAVAAADRKFPLS